MTPTSAAARITSPDQLRLPHDIQRVRALFAPILEGLEDHRMWAFAPLLTEQGRAAFVDQIIGGLVKASQTNDLRPVQDTLESWYVTSLFAEDSQFFADYMDSTDDPALEISQVLELLGV